MGRKHRGRTRFSSLGGKFFSFAGGAAADQNGLHRGQQRFSLTHLKEIEHEAEEQGRARHGDTSGIGLEAATLFRAEGAKVDVAATFGRIDVVFANAGAGTAAPLEAVTPETINDQFALNFTGLLLTIQKAAPLIPHGGSIVATTSFLNAVGTPGLSISSATKAAIRSLVRSLGVELRRAVFASTQSARGRLPRRFIRSSVCRMASCRKRPLLSRHRCCSSASARPRKSRRPSCS